MQDEREKIEFIDKAKLPTKWGEFVVYAYADNRGKTHLALVKGEVAGKRGVVVRVHSRCLTGDALGSLRCDCGAQYEKAMKYISEQKEGIMLYMNQEGRGIGLANKIRAYALQDKGLDTVEANHQLGFADDIRVYDNAAIILKNLGVKSITLLSNNPRKISGLEKEGIIIDERISIITPENKYDEKYLKTKKEKMGHLFEETK